MDINRYRLQDKKLYVIVDVDDFFSEDDFLDSIAVLLSEGVEILQIKSEKYCASEMIRLGKKVRELCSIYNALFILRERADIAKAVDADGVHLSKRDIDICLAREILGKTSIIGFSVEDSETTGFFKQEGVDYLLVGSFAETIANRRKEAAGECICIDNAEIPCFYIFDSDKDSLRTIISAGIKRVAVRIGITSSKNLEKAIKSISEKLK